MTCEAVRERLPDYTLGTLPELEEMAVRRHLRGCAGCRAEASTLDQGMAMFASAAHAIPPPPELKERVLSVMTDEWADAPAPRAPRRVPAWWRLATAAAVVLLLAALAWGGLATARASRLRSQGRVLQAVATRFREDAGSYRGFLHALGGRDVRVASLKGAGTTALEGSAVLYDSDIGQSWILVMVRAPGQHGPIRVTVSSASGHSIRLFPIHLDAEGDGATWLVSSANISSFRYLRLTSPTGVILGTGITIEG
jgi:hypothetical protein